jgi:hypothetical protein
MYHSGHSSSTLCRDFDGGIGRATPFKQGFKCKGAVPVDFTEISVRGNPCKVPCLLIEDNTIVVTGRFPRIAAIKDEDWIEGDIVRSPFKVIDSLRQTRTLSADVFTFCETVGNPTPRFSFLFRWDSVAAIPIVSFSNWWTKRVSSHVRQDINRAAKRGVVVREVSLTDEFVHGIVNIYNETPIRQGRPFWHYGKSFEAVKQMSATYLERTAFLGAFLGEELIGFLKLVYVDRIARLMQIVAKDAHRDKRPMNALIAKAVELCEAQRCSHLIYGNYRYFQGSDSLTAFKHRCGFEEVLVPRYYVPLSTVGRVALYLRLERGPRAWVPAPVQESVRRMRAGIYRRMAET